MRLKDYPDGFAISDEGAAIDLTEPFGDSPECREIGIRDADVQEGLVQGDLVVRGDPNNPPGSAAVTAATRVRKRADALSAIDEFNSPMGRACLATESTPPGTPTVVRSASGETIVSTVKTPTSGYALILVAKNVTVAAGLVIAVGEPLDDTLISRVKNRLLERAA